MAEHHEHHRPGEATTTLRVVLELAPGTEALLVTPADLARHILHRLNRMEQKMTDLEDLLALEQATIGDISRVLTTTAADVAVLLSSATGVFTPDERAKADAALASLNALATAASNLSAQVGDRDGDGNPATPTEPPTTPEEPPPAPPEF